MLVLTMRSSFDHEGDDSRVRVEVNGVVVWVTLLSTVGTGKARLAFEAPDSVEIKRQGLLDEAKKYRARPVYRR